MKQVYYFPLPLFALMEDLFFSDPLPFFLSPLPFLPADVFPFKTRFFWEHIQFIFGSFFITGKRNYYRCPMEYGLGITTIKDTPRVMGAPPSIVKKLKKYLIFSPGDQNKNTVANEIASRLAMPVETIQSVLPPGDIQILEDHL